MASEVGTPAARRRKMHVLADHVGLDREDQLEFARALLHRDITTRSALTDEQINRLLDAYEGYIKISWLLDSR